MHPFDAFQQKPFPRRRAVIERIFDGMGLNRFFLREGNRPQIRVEDEIVVSPAEGKLAEIQTLRSNEAIRGKEAMGRRENYSFADLVHGERMSEAFEGGLCFNLYLSPFNLHYLLYPAHLRVTHREYHPAFCWPILFMKSGEVRNERLAIYAETPAGIPFIILLIGSFLVSGIECLADVGGEYATGDLMGGFKLGSTVMLLFPKDTVEPLARPGSSLLLGEPLARFQASRR